MQSATVEELEWPYQCISFLLLCNKGSQIQHLKTIPIYQAIVQQVMKPDKSSSCLKKPKLRCGQAVFLYASSTKQSASNNKRASTATVQRICFQVQVCGSNSTAIPCSCEAEVPISLIHGPKYLQANNGTSNPSCALNF